MVDFAIASILGCIASPSSQSADLIMGKFCFSAAGASDLGDDEFAFLARDGWFLCFLLSMTGWTARGEFESISSDFRAGLAF